MSAVKPAINVEKRVEVLTPEDGKLFDRCSTTRQMVIDALTDPVAKRAAERQPPYAHRLYVTDAPLEELNVIAADAVQNLRQALDHAACASARVIGNGDEHVHFPVRSGTSDQTAAAVENKRFKDNIRFLPLAARQVIKESDVGGGMLYQLHILSLADKHRYILGCIPFAEERMLWMTAKGWIVSGFDTDSWDEGRNCLTYAVSDSPESVDYKFSFDVDFRFAYVGDLARLSAIESLRRLADVIETQITNIEEATASSLSTEQAGC
jgi:hypothetical protein